MASKWLPRKSIKIGFSAHKQTCNCTVAFSSVVFMELMVTPECSEIKSLIPGGGCDFQEYASSAGVC